jgi:general secretion pathway protein E
MKRDDAPLPAPDLAFFAAVSRAARGARVPMLELAAAELKLGADEALAACAAACGWPVLSGAALQALVPDFQRLPLAEAEALGALAAFHEARLVVLLDDPLDRDRVDRLEHRIDREFDYVLAAAEEIRALLKRAGAGARASEGADDTDGSDGGGAAERSAATELTLAGIAAETSAVVRQVDAMLYDALAAGASDLHLESDAGGLAVKLRVDGVLDAAGRVNGRALAEQVISRIKVLAELDIAERRVPQDGRFQVRSDGRDIDLRVSIMPAVHGEDAVLRILDRKRLSADLQELRFEVLGFDAPVLAELRRLARAPYGLMLVTGPTGSGKTTTLYAALSEIHDGLAKIVTIEDPVEYQLAGVVQVPVNDKRGLTFSRGLRSILRHDPDVIMVGEIRDAETGQIAVQAALTGHLVFTTVHANSVFDVIGRMLHIGVDPFNLVSALNGIVAQRLMRQVCPHCRHEAKLDPAVLAARNEAERARLAGARLVEGRGCGHCRGTGYRGRRAVAEVLTLDDALRDAIAQRQSIGAIKALARARRLRTLREAALDAVAAGQSTLAELDRISLAEGAP